MIVACPACSARYRIDKSKIKGRGAKITCPRCAHKFVIYKEKGTQDIAESDFNELGITWRVKKGLGVIQTFHSLGELLKLIEDDQVSEQDTVSYDNRTWIPLHSVENLAGFFSEIWKRAERGELKISEEPEEPEEDEFIEDEFDSPTTVIKDRDLLLRALAGDDPSVTPPSQTPSPIYRTRGAATRPTYLSDDLGDPLDGAEQVVRVHDPKHIKPELKKKPKEPEPDSNPNQLLIGILVITFCLTAVFAVLLAFKIEVPFLTQRTEVKPQTPPTITTPIDRPNVPDHEKDVPTEPTPTPPESADQEGSETEADDSPPETDSQPVPPPTGEVDAPPGDTP